MSDPKELELFRALTAAQDKYTYFMLASVGATLGFALTQTRDAIWTWTLLPLAIATVLWIASFYSGCRCLLLRNTAMFANITLIQVGSGGHRALPNPAERSAQLVGIGDAIRESVERSSSHARWQFRSFIAGTAFYIIWHALEMYMRTSAQ